MRHFQHRQPLGGVDFLAGSVGGDERHLGHEQAFSCLFATKGIIQLLDGHAGQGGPDATVHPPFGEGLGGGLQALGRGRDGIAVAGGDGAIHTGDGCIDILSLAFRQEVRIGAQRRLHRQHRPAGLHRRLGEQARRHIVLGVDQGVTQHVGHLVLGQAIGWLDRHLLLHPSGGLAGGDGQQAVGVHREGDADAGRASRHVGNAAQHETGQRAVLVDHLALALQHMDGHGGLAVLVGGEFLGHGHRDRGVARNDLFHDAAHGLDAEAQRRHVQQQGVGTDGQRLGLQGGADGDHLVRVDVGQGLAAEQVTHLAPHQRHAGRAAHQHHALDFRDLDPGVLDHAPADGHGLVHPGKGQGLQFVAGHGVPGRLAVHLDHPISGGAARQAFLGDAGGGQGLLGLARRDALDAVLLVALGQEALGDGVIDVVAAQSGIAPRGLDLEHALFHAQDGNVEGAAAQIVDGVEPLGGVIQAVGQGGRRGLVDQAQHLEAGQTGGVLGRRAGSVVEIGGNGDHGAVDALALGLFGAGLDGAQDVGRDLHRSQGPPGDLEPHHAAVGGHVQGVGQRAGQGLEVLGAAAHQALDRADHMVGGFQDHPPRVGPHRDGAVVAVIHHGRDQSLAVGIAQNLGRPVAGQRHHRIGGAQVDADRQAAFGFVGGRALAGFMKLQQHARATLRHGFSWRGPLRPAWRGISGGWSGGRPPPDGRR
ncbi:NAD-specific glutamate dehydrogenase [Paramagnetospirillum caucaseum]|uniref:NAD-specific glutamate dehydrogenase n=1 Tax=Paramagnetospirillum caucaseum TaxID=1244869 RepID=M3A883_9PROT|nr:NAD-specific glutamate dehydrogenase [Paramagnetospirillum caucaseum]